tara:strand:- start:865 stop:1356 length:492 start_codon:yes stop_codon:yes gene_type:complete
MNSKSYVRKLIRESFLNEAPPGGMFGNFKHLKKNDKGINNSSSKDLKDVKTWYEHPVFDKSNILDKKSEKMMKDAFEKIESILLSSYFGGDKESFSEKIKDLFKQYKSLMQRGFDDVAGRNGAISASLINDLRNLSLNTKKLLSKKTPTAALNNYVRNWLQLK